MLLANLLQLIIITRILKNITRKLIKKESLEQFTIEVIILYVFSQILEQIHISFMAKG